MIKLVVMASSEYPLPVLDTLINDKEFSLGLIVTRPDRPVGRKKIITKNPVKVWAEKNHLPVITPPVFAGAGLHDLLQKLTEIQPDLGLVANFGLKIPPEIFTSPKHETVNIHFSLLPKYRGGAPLEHTIINGDKETGISVLKLSDQFDEGDIIFQEKILLKGNETVAGLYRSLFSKTAVILPDVLKKYLIGQIKPVKQIGNPVFALKKDLGDGKIDWTKSPEELERYIRALNPNPGTWTEIEINGMKKRLKILKAHLENGKLILDEVQLEGKNPVSYKQFCQNFKEAKIFQ